uniref:Uncharacterized protein n=1 Tax=Arundo donax TaxID=35708 RepID=A0A0A8XT95_ARUDO
MSVCCLSARIRNPWRAFSATCAVLDEGGPWLEVQAWLLKDSQPPAEKEEVTFFIKKLEKNKVTNSVKPLLIHRGTPRQVRPTDWACILLCAVPLHVAESDFDGTYA